jgi:hypothetical protein
LSGAYASSATAYARAGWSPVPVDGKHPPLAGLTGWRGRTVDVAAAEGLTKSHGAWNIGLRMPPDVIGVDVDVYNGGDVTLRALEVDLGALPPSPVMSTARDDGSGIQLYRRPVGWHLAGVAGTGIELVQAHHRYVMCAPSMHPKVGKPYRWLDPQTGDEVDFYDLDVDDLPELPWAWLERFHRTKGKGALPVTPDEANEFLERHTAARKPDGLDGVRQRLAEVQRGGRHDALVECACWAMREAAAGWYPAAEAAEALTAWWAEAVEEDPARVDGDEFGDALLWAIAQAKAEPERIAALAAEVPPSTEERTGWRARLVDGKSWLMSGGDAVEALWGDETYVLAPRLQPTMLAGISGVGKTTLTHRLSLGALGVAGFEELLGLAVTPTAGNVLLLASDRPDQARLSMRRMVTTSAAWSTVEERLVVWPGPPPADLAKEPTLLVEMAREAKATLVVPDSLKDMAMKLSDDATGSAVNHAFQLVTADGRDLIIPHHVRKIGRQDVEKSITIDDLYGSAWLFNGCGSVLYLERGAVDVELRQLKTPNGREHVVRFTLGLDGTVDQAAEGDPVLALVAAAGTAGISTSHVARCAFGKDKPAGTEVERVRRRLKALEVAGLIVAEGTGNRSRWVVAA